MQRMTVQREPIQPRSRNQQLLCYTVTVVLMVTSGLVSISYAKERLAHTGDVSNHVQARFQAQPLGEKTLGAIRGKGGVDAPQAPINLSIILWDEPGPRGNKPQALTASYLGNSVRGLTVNDYDGVSIGTK